MMRQKIYPIPHGSVLRIENVKWKVDDSFIECLAENGNGPAARTYARLSVYKEDEKPQGYPEITENPEMKSTEKDRPTDMKCSATGNPPPIISWYKDYVPIDIDPTRMKLEAGGRLIIKTVETSDEGKYECVAENSVGVAYSYGANLYVKTRRVPPHFTLMNRTYHVNMGANLNVTCNAVGSPLPKVRWRQGDIDLTPDNKVTGGRSVLVLTDIRQSGTYKCIASSELGNIEHDIDVHIEEPSGAPQNFTATGFNNNPKSVKLQWNAPSKDHRNGEIIVYEVMYHLANNPTIEWRPYNTTNDSYIFDSLKPNTEYNFQTRAYTKEGPGPWSNQLLFKTASQYSYAPPVNIQLKRQQPSEMDVSWDHPPASRGIIGYRVYYNTVAIPDINQWSYSEVKNSQTSHHLTGLEALSVYVVRVRAVYADGKLGNLSEIVYSNKLENERPDMVRDFHARTSNPRSITLEWKPPKKPGLSKYKIEYLGYKKTMNQKHNLEETVIDVKRSFDVEKEEKSFQIDDLLPHTLYIINITSMFIDGSRGPAYQLKVETSSSTPPILDAPTLIRAVGEGSVLLRLTSSTTTPHYGNVQYYVVVMFANERRNPEDILIDELKGPQKDGWVASKFDVVLPKEMVLGDGGRSASGDFINYRLRRDQVYKIFIRAVLPENKVSRSIRLSSSSPYSAFISMEKLEVKSQMMVGNFDLLWVVGPMCAAIVLILLVVLIIIFNRNRNRENNAKRYLLPKQPAKLLMTPTELSINPTDPVEIRRTQYHTQAMASHPPIPVSEFGGHVESLKACDGVLFSQEYESIDPGQQFTWETSSLDCNKSKNRYANVIAYDHSRVVLPMLDGRVGSDYINANFIDGYRKSNAYIATQGPLPETFGDFWRMVWDERVTIIVMMTKLEERGRVKCDQYWPNRGTEVYACVHVTLVDVVELAIYTLRTFLITKSGHPDRVEVRQFQFTAWPDHGVPEHPTALLMFMRRVKSYQTPEAGPIVVHCSAGVGRTGAFIVVDAMLERARFEKTIDVYGHVTCMRAQRNYMVQTEDQYVFVHDAILEGVVCGCTEIPARNLYAHMQKLMSLEPESASNLSLMEMEFKKLSTTKITSSQYVSASLQNNKFKNRFVNILPFESTRVALQMIRGVEGSDYINANFIDGYRYKKAYIATQGPLASTTEDFWRMLWEHNSTIVVMLVKLREAGREKCHQYWPSERSARYQYFVVDPMAEYNMPQYILREFKVTDARDGQSRTIRQFQFTDWPEQGVPKSGEGFIDFIGQVHKTKEQFGQDGPITVHCSAGVSKTGVFIALSIVLERMRYEGVVDLFQTVKLLRTQRPCMVQTESTSQNPEDHYAFCYRAALEYLGSFDHYAN
ncbi:hypothetical protein HELRODRAFT_98742 [Helobdella robusta]|uniref:protein-tyrosine-phosphatase n=1 Tax=Helobdella robusta TaxID=6412 RepID=T1G9P5_HELRO|nr:hypothetical protein HELRODRAFT_98742 [Helobdella robusta]ESO06781.1 hypothetical protein HELRODRAFT_98742 [Helobdella robusta]